MSSAMPVLHPTMQPTNQQPCHPTTFQMMHPVAAEVLQRVEAQSSVDIESYVRALGDKRYAAVKGSKRTALLRRARAEKGVTELDDATIRRHTNLASAEASRAKKEFILEELHSQLKKKSEDAVVLANELRRLLAMVEQLRDENHQLDVQLHQQRFVYDSFLPAHSQMQGQVVNVAMTPHAAAPRFTVWDGRKCEPQPESEDQFFSVATTAMEEDNHQTEYSPMMDQEQAAHVTSAAMTVTTTNTATDVFSQEQRQSVLPAFDMGENLKIEALMCPPNIGAAYDVDEAKLNVLQSNLPSLQPDIAESLALSVSNPSNQYTVAG